MADKERADMQAREKTEAAASAENMQPGPTFTPAVDIYETEKGITLTADIPGVKAGDLSIDIKDSILTLEGNLKSPEGPDELDVLREYETGRYRRSFTLSDVIDQARIEAELKDGVLRLLLPKVEPAAPRKITVKTA